MRKWKKTVSGAVFGLAVLAAAGFSGCDAATAGEENYTAGMTALAEENYETALQNFTVLVQDTDRKAEGYRGEGIACLRMENYTEAAAALEKAAEAASAEKKSVAFQDDIRLYLAEAYLQSGDPARAETLCKEVKEGSQTALANVLLGRALLEEQDYAGAEEAFEKAVASGLAYDGYMQIYQAYTEKNRQADGAAYLRKALEQEAEEPADLYAQGKIAYVLQKTDLAIADLKQAMEGGEKAAVPLLGKLYRENGDTENAQKLYEACLADDELKAEGYNGLGLCAMQEGDYAGALENFQEGIVLQDPTCMEELLFNEITAYEKMLDFGTAEEKMKAFLEQYPDNAAAVHENTFLQSRQS